MSGVEMQQLLSKIHVLPIPGGAFNTKTGEFISSKSARMLSEREEQVIRIAVLLEVEPRLIREATKAIGPDGLDEIYWVAARGDVVFTDGKFVGKEK